MTLTSHIFLGIHILCVIAMVGLLLAQGGKNVKKMPKGFTHAALTAAVAGVVLVITESSLHKSHPASQHALNMGIIAAKFVVLLAILIVGFKNEKKESLANSQWWLLLGLIVVNLGLAGQVSH
jgi:drug/metabolite transporter (DMT)-like permease